MLWRHSVYEAASRRFAIADSGEAAFEGRLDVLSPLQSREQLQDFGPNLIRVLFRIRHEPAEGIPPVLRLPNQVPGGEPWGAVSVREHDQFGRSRVEVGLHIGGDQPLCDRHVYAARPYYLGDSAERLRTVS